MSSPGSFIIDRRRKGKVICRSWIFKFQYGCNILGQQHWLNLQNSWYCSGYNRRNTIYMQSNKIHKVFLMSEFYSAFMLARHISDLTGPSSGAFLTSCIRRFGMWYYCAHYLTLPAVTFVTAGRVEQYAYYHIPNLRIQLVRNAPDDGPVSSETCRANLSAE